MGFTSHERQVAFAGLMNSIPKIVYHGRWRGPTGDLRGSCGSVNGTVAPYLLDAEGARKPLSVSMLHLRNAADEVSDARRKRSS